MRDPCLGRAYHDGVPPLSLADHDLCTGAQAVKGSPHGHVNRSPEAFHLRRVKGLTVAVDGAGDENIEPAELADQLIGHSFHRRLVRDVHWKEQDAASEG